MEEVNDEWLVSVFYKCQKDENLTEFNTMQNTALSQNSLEGVLSVTV